MHHDPTACGSLGDGAHEFDLRLAQVLCNNDAEHVRRHHAQRRTTQHLVAERAAPIFQHDALVVLLDNAEVALDASLQVNQNLGHLGAAQHWNGQLFPVVGVDLIADALADDTDEARGFIQADHILQGAGEFPQHRSKEEVPVERQRDVPDRDRVGRRRLAAEARGDAVFFLAHSSFLCEFDAWPILAKVTTCGKAQRQPIASRSAELHGPRRAK